MKTPVVKKLKKSNGKKKTHPCLSQTSFKCRDKHNTDQLWTS